MISPALGLLELESLARGVVVSDALVKKARVRVVIGEAVTPGKYLLVFLGDVAEVEESFAEGVAVAGPKIVDQLLITALSPQVLDGLLGRVGTARPNDALGLLETQTVASAILAADAAVKRANVRLTHMQLARGIGGKGWFTLAGEQADVEAALEGGAAAIEPVLLVATEIIQRPHAELAHGRK